jgi:hypothetical protein
MQYTCGDGEPLVCPSAQPEIPGATLFGVVLGTVDEPRVVQLAEPQPVTPELLELAGPVNPTEVFRFAAPCAGTACAHFDGARCRLATSIVELVAPVTDTLTPCRIRPHCRWYQQEGRAACLRCPGVVTENCMPSPQMIQAADPAQHKSTSMNRGELLLRDLDSG